MHGFALAKRLRSPSPIMAPSYGPTQRAFSCSFLFFYVLNQLFAEKMRVTLGGQKI